MEPVSTRLENAKRKWSEVAGGKLLSTDPSDIQKFSVSTGIIANTPAAVLKPISQAELCEAVKIAAEFSIGIYPVSGGKNWGYGSASPLKENCVVIDLSGMNKILEVNEQLAYAVIEPGVSPLQIYQHLLDRNIPLRIDTSGAPADSSLVGNICERGHGFTRYSDHFLNSCAYEVVLADGSLLKTGHSNLHKWGVGPSLDGLFTQSNFGIISKLTIWLLPKTEYFGILNIKIHNDKDLGTVVDKIRGLKLQGMFPEALHIYNKERVESSLQIKNSSAVAAWNISSALFGDKSVVKLSVSKLKSELAGAASVKYYSHVILSLAARFSGLFKLATGIKFLDFKDSIELLQGKPSNSHLRMVYQDQSKFNANVDLARDACGVFWYAPLIPANSESTEILLKFIREILGRHNIQENVSLIFFNERSLCCIVSVLFNKENEAESAKALAIYRELVSEGLKLGFVPYRMSPEALDLVLTNEAANKTNTALKLALDPQNIMSPGRYAP